jgi:hypothetical protein
MKRPNQSKRTALLPMEITVVHLKYSDIVVVQCGGLLSVWIFGQTNMLVNCNTWVSSF